VKFDVKVLRLYRDCRRKGMGSVREVMGAKSILKIDFERSRSKDRVRKIEFGRLTLED
jgi:hypothetical protein